MTDAVIHLTTLLVALALFVGLWPLSLRRRDASIVDAVWGPGFAVAVWLAWILSGAEHNERAYLLLALISAWSLRLSLLMSGRKRRAPGEDPRYTMLRNSWEPGFWWKSLFVVFMLQATLQWAISLAAQRAVTAPVEPLGALALLGAVVALVGLAIETVADAQLDRFKATGANAGLCVTGLWAWCRHPNYFGEILFWWGVWIIVAPVAELWTVLSPLLITALIRWVSGVPIVEEHLETTKRGYDAYRETTPTILPRRPALRRAE